MTMVIFGFNDACVEPARHVVHALEGRDDVGSPVHERDAGAHARQNRLGMGRQNDAANGAVQRVPRVQQRVFGLDDATPS